MSVADVLSDGVAEIEAGLEAYPGDLETDQLVRVRDALAVLSAVRMERDSPWVCYHPDVLRKVRSVQGFADLLEAQAAVYRMNLARTPEGTSG